MLYFTLKALHLACVVLWFGALFTVCQWLPRLNAAPAESADPGTPRRSAARRLWRDVASPSAGLAIVLGIVLMLTGHSADWVALKLIAVACLVLVHVAAGVWLHALLEPDAPHWQPRWLGALMSCVLLVLFLLIAALSAAKPGRDSLTHIPAVAARHGVVQSVRRLSEACVRSHCGFLRRDVSRWP